MLPMRNFQLINSLRLCKFDLKINLKTIIGWCIAMFSVMFLYMILFPSIQEIAKAKMEAMPKELLQFVGMENFSDMSNFVSYYGIIFNLALIAISIFAVTFSSNLLYREEKSKTIEFLYSLETSRLEIYIAKLITAFIGVFVVRCSTMFAALLCGFINGGETFSAIKILKITAISGFIPFFFMAVGSALSAVSARIGAPVTGSMIVIFSYMLGYLGKLLEENAAWLKYLSPFELFQAEHALSLNNEIIFALIFYLILMVLICIVGALVYKKRDYVV